MIGDVLKVIIHLLTLVSFVSGMSGGNSENFNDTRVHLFLCAEGGSFWDEKLANSVMGVKLKIETHSALLYSPIGAERVAVTFGLYHYNTTNCTESAESFSSELQFTKFGHVAINDGNGYLQWYPPAEYCITLSNNSVSAGIASVRKLNCDWNTVPAPPTNGTSVIIAKKCCPPGYVIDYSTREFIGEAEAGSYVPVCREARKNWLPSFYDPSSVNKDVCLLASRESIRYQFVTQATYFDRVLPLPRKRVEAPGGVGYVLGSRWRLLSNGSYVIFRHRLSRLSHWGEWRILNVLCQDVLTNFSRSNASDVTEIVFAFAKDYQPDYNLPGPATELPKLKNRTAILNGTMTLLELNSSLKTTVIVWVFYLSTIPLILTMFAYGLTWKKQNVYGWTVMSHLFTLTLKYFAFGTGYVVHQVTEYVWEIGWGWCRAIEILEIYFFLSSFIWLTAMNFDLWWKFRSHLPHTSGSKRDISRYLLYALLAFGIPLTFVLTGVVLDGIHGDVSGTDSDCDIFTPSFGVYTCIVSSNAEGFFMYYPSGILMTLNILFYILTIRNIYTSRQSTRNILNRNHNVDLLSLSIFTKLFFVTGVTFAVELVRWICHPGLTNIGETADIWYILSVLDIFGRSIGIFIVFACKKQVSMELKSKWRKLRNISVLNTKEESTTKSTDVSLPVI